MYGENDWVSQIELKKVNNNPGVTIFKDTGCNLGFAGIFYEGDHDVKDLERNHIGNDGANGIVVP